MTPETIDSGTQAFIQARAIHRVIRAMNDGSCPACGHIADRDKFSQDSVYSGEWLVCPNCNFHITPEETAAGMALFLPFMQESLEIFQAWRASQNTDKGENP